MYHLLAGTLVYRQDPDLVGQQNMCPELVAGSAGRTSIGTFLPLSPKPMLGPDTRAIAVGLRKHLQ